jgi:hypothetical protein
MARNRNIVLVAEFADSEQEIASERCRSAIARLAISAECLDGDA